MKTRTTAGHYTGHNSPGDGTGFSRVPESDAQAFMGKQTVERDSTPTARRQIERHEPVRSK